MRVVVSDVWLRVRDDIDVCREDDVNAEDIACDGLVPNCLRDEEVDRDLVLCNDDFCLLLRIVNRSSSDYVCCGML